MIHFEVPSVENGDSLVPKEVALGEDHKFSYSFYPILPGLRQVAQFLSQPQFLTFNMELVMNCCRSYVKDTHIKIPAQGLDKRCLIRLFVMLIFWQSS